jgi:anionic cell wall polymer biosynthesis LytR-Cps2A-Psr (LCP) family protein
VEVVNPYEVVGDAEIPSFPAGPLILTGEEALVFVRTRSQDTDDGRVMRQQLVLAALLDKLRDPAVVANLPALIAATRGTVETDIPLPVQLDLIDLLPELTAERVTFHTITDSLTGGFIDNGMWVYQADWTVLPGVVQGYLNGTL